MAYEQKNGTGTVWKNDKYTVGGNQPYAKGTVKDLNGNDLDIALWIPKSDKIKGFNVTIQEPYVKPKESAQPQSISDESGDSLPF